MLPKTIFGKFRQRNSHYSAFVQFLGKILFKVFHLILSPSLNYDAMTHFVRTFPFMLGW